jgi:transposase
MTVQMVRHDHTPADLRAAAARSKDAAYSRRVLALALVAEGAARKDAAETCGMDRQTLRDWVLRYNAEGLAGLCNRPHAGGPSSKLTEAQTTKLAEWVRSGPDPEKDRIVRWRLKDLQHRIAADFQVTMHERSVGKVLARLNFSHISARPRNPKADEEAQEAHKKTSANSLRRSSPTRHASGPSNFGGRTKRGWASKAA